MKNSLILLLIMIAYGYLGAQPIKNPVHPTLPPLPDGTRVYIPQADTIYNVYLIDTPPIFPGGEDSLKQYIYKNLHYPEIAKENDIQGTVYTSFIIDKEGNVTNPQIKKGIAGNIGKACDMEALRVIKTLPKWMPGRHNGKPVKVEYIFPIRFRLM